MTLLEKINNLTWYDLINKLKDILKGLNDKPSGGYEPPYKVYTALLTQSGTNAPVATVLENTLGGEIIWSRNSVGIYTATLLGAFIDNKTTIQIIANTGKGYTTTSSVNDVDSVFLGMVNTVNSLADDILGNTPIEIRVYN